MLEGSDRSPGVVTSDDALHGSENGITFWRGFNPDAAGTQVFLARALAEPGTKIPPHVHTADTVAYLVDGRAVFRTGDGLTEVHELNTGDWLFVPAGVVHVEETPEDSAAEFLYARDSRGGETTYFDET